MDEKLAHLREAADLYGKVVAADSVDVTDLLAEGQPEAMHRLVNGFVSLTSILLVKLGRATGRQEPLPRLVDRYSTLGGTQAPDLAA